MCKHDNCNNLISADYGGMAKIKVNSTLLWKPDIVLHNSVTGNFKTTEQGHHYKSKSSGSDRVHRTQSIVLILVTIYENGTVEWQPAALYQTSCGIDTKERAIFDKFSKIFKNFIKFTALLKKNRK